MLPWAQTEQDVADAVTHVNLAPPGGRDPLAGNVLLCIVSAGADGLLLLNIGPLHCCCRTLQPLILLPTFPAAMLCLQPRLVDFLPLFCACST